MSGFLKRILVPVDGSPAANRAVAVACALARDVQAELVFCDAVNHAAAIAELTVPYGIPDATPLLDALDGAARGVSAEAEGVAKAAGIPGSSVVLDGRAAGAIVDYVRANAVDAVVMGTRGASGLERIFTGSTADGVLRHTGVPVLVVQAVEDAPAPAFKRLVVAVDDSEQSAAAVAFALDLAAAENGLPIFTHVISTKALGDTSREYAYDPEPLVAQARAEAQAALDKAEAAAKARGIASETYVVEGDPVEQILKAAADHRADVIALGTHGRTGLQRLFLGSVAEGVVQGSTLPVAVIHR